MELRITPFSSFSTRTKTAGKSKSAINYAPISKQSSHKNADIQKLSKKSISKPQFSVKISTKKIPTTNIFQQSAVADKKGVLLYQQIERNKLFSNGSELINRFHFKT